MCVCMRARDECLCRHVCTVCVPDVYAAFSYSMCVESVLSFHLQVPEMELSFPGLPSKHMLID